MSSDLKIFDHGVWSEPGVVGVCFSSKPGKRVDNSRMYFAFLYEALFPVFSCFLPDVFATRCVSFQMLRYFFITSTIRWMAFFSQRSIPAKQIAVTSFLLSLCLVWRFSVLNEREWKILRCGKGEGCGMGGNGHSILQRRRLDVDVDTGKCILSE